jgi:uncharacterized repeat protein (TIGR03803 family)
VLFLFDVLSFPSTSAAQSYKDLYNFDNTHGCDPTRPGLLSEGRDGNLYSTVWCGGTYNVGVVFRITPSGSQTVLYNFDYVHGTNPAGGLTLGTDGNFYGVTPGGGANNFGTIFKITPNGNLTTLYNFTGSSDGNNPGSPPVQASDGNLYGTTSTGVGYKITHAGLFTTLGSTGHGSSNPIIQGSDGKFYGANLYGGDFGLGAVFNFTPDGTATTLHSFGATDGNMPECILVQLGNGYLYGTTALGGTLNGGVVFRMTTQGVTTTLHNFDPTTSLDGNIPPVGMVLATDGNFYGVAAYGGTLGYGVIFKITSTGDYSIVHNFDLTNGGNPFSTLTQHTNGKIYGMTISGGPIGMGVVYSLDLGLSPFVKLLPTSGRVSNSIGILGQGFRGTTAVSFNGTAATFTVKSSTYMTAVVPPGASTGFVEVTTPSGTLMSNTKFRVTH